MPNHRMANARKTALQQRPCGIIRVTALCPLCRYRHKTHWTGGEKRLNREAKGRYGSPEYAREELIAEISAAFIGANIGLVPTVRHADYLGFWLDILREDKRAIFRATSQATKAADYILAFREGEERREAA